MREPSVPEKRRGKKAAPVSSEETSGLFTALKALRFKLAQQEKVPAYIIFSNASLADMRFAISIPESVSVMSPSLSIVIYPFSRRRLVV